MSNNMIAITTQLGKQKVFDAESNSIKIKITHIAVGDGAYTPTQDQTTLVNEIDRIPIASSEISAEEYLITFGAVIDNQNEYWVNEIGFLLEDGTLFAVWSHPTIKMGYKTAVNKFLLGYNLKLVDVNIDAIEVVDQGIDLKLSYAKELREMAISNWQTTEAIAEFVRNEKNTGIMTVGQREEDVSQAFNHSLTDAGSAIKIHNHPNYPGQPGIGWFTGNANGYIFQSRHNDYTLVNPAPNGGYMETVQSASPGVPPSITGTVAEQIDKMQELFDRYYSSSLTPEEKHYFQWELAYAEVWWEIVDSPDSEIEDTFESFRHTYGTVTPLSMAQVAMQSRITGKKDRFENFSYMPFATKIDINGEQKYCVLRYRIITVPLPDMRGKKWNLLMDQRDDMVVEAREDEGVAFSDSSERFTLFDLDAHIAEAPSVGGYSENFSVKTVDDHDVTDPANAARYHRTYSIGADAMGASTYSNGWNDPTLIVAHTQNEKVFGGTSYMIPLEMILRTPLETWNPYGLVEANKADVTGDGSDASPYSNITQKGIWKMTPAEFFLGNYDASAADTGTGASYVLDAGGTKRLVMSSGIWIRLPEIGGYAMPRTRLRYPVYYAAHEYSPESIALSAALKKNMSMELAQTASLTTIRAELVKLFKGNMEMQDKLDKAFSQISRISRQNDLSLEELIELIEENMNAITKANSDIAQTDQELSQFKSDLNANIKSYFHQVYYVDATNGSDSNDGSQGSPFATIYSCFTDVPKGGVVEIHLADSEQYNLGLGVIDISDITVYIQGTDPDVDGHNAYIVSFLSGDSSGGFYAPNGDMNLYMDNCWCFTYDYGDATENQGFIGTVKGTQNLSFTNGKVYLSVENFLESDDLLANLYFENVEVERPTSSALLLTIRAATALTTRLVTVTGNTTNLRDLVSDTANYDSVIGDTGFAGPN